MSSARTALANLLIFVVVVFTTYSISSIQQKQSISSSSTNDDEAWNKEIDFAHPPTLRVGPANDDRPAWTNQVKFMVIGVQKGGTTSMFRYLIQHPLVITARGKETRCLKWKWDPTDPFCERSFFKDYLLRNPSFVTGDFSPGYIFETEDVLPRMKRSFPHVKLVAILRNPVDRAYSEYNMVLHNNNTNATFEHDILKDLEFIRRAGLLPHWKFENDDINATLQLQDYSNAVIDMDVFRKFHGSLEERDAWSRYHLLKLHTRTVTYVGQGLYAVELRFWFDSFPRDQFLLLKTEDMHVEGGVDDMMKRVHAHIGIPYALLREEDGALIGKYESDIPADCKEVLEKLYAPYNEALYSLLGNDDEWKNVWTEEMEQ